MADTRFGKNTDERIKSLVFILLQRKMAMKNASTTFSALVKNAYISVWSTEELKEFSEKNILKLSRPQKVAVSKFHTVRL